VMGEVEIFLEPVLRKSGSEFYSRRKGVKR
jgi:hypothetical protein